MLKLRNTVENSDASSESLSYELNVADFLRFVGESLSQGMAMSAIVQMLITTFASQPININGKVEKLLYTLALRNCFQHINSVSEFTAQAREIVADPIIPCHIKEALAEVLADTLMSQQDVQELYGIKPLVTAEEMSERMWSLGARLAQKDAPQMVVFNGAAHVALSMGLSQFVPVTMSATDGQKTLSEAKIDDISKSMLRRLFVADPFQQVTIVEDVIDTAATLGKLLLEVIQMRLSYLDAASHPREASGLRTMIMSLKNLVAQASYMNRMKPNSGSGFEIKRSEVRQELESILSDLHRPPFSVNLVVAANKLLDRWDNIPAIDFIAPSFAHDAETGELLDKDKLHWLMGLGLDTEMKLYLDSPAGVVPFKVSLGRQLQDIVAMVEPTQGDFVDMKAFARLREFTVSVLEQLGIGRDQIIWPEELKEN
jgi:hypothetical protein